MAKKKHHVKVHGVKHKKFPKRPKRPKKSASLHVWENYDHKCKEWEHKCSMIVTDAKKKKTLIDKHHR